MNGAVSAQTPPAVIQSSGQARMPPAMRTISPDNVIPIPTPPNSQPMRAASPAAVSASATIPAAKKENERTGDTRDCPKSTPHRKGIGKPRGEGCRDACDQREAEDQKTRMAFWNKRRKKCANEIADKIDRRDQTRDVRTETDAALHKGKHGRVEKPPNSHAHRERKKAAEEKPVSATRIERRRGQFVRRSGGLSGRGLGQKRIESCGLGCSAQLLADRLIA
jgi:hypothetical protein